MLAVEAEALKLSEKARTTRANLLALYDDYALFVEQLARLEEMKRQEVVSPKGSTGHTV